MKKLLIMLMAVAMVAFLFAGCFITPDPDDPVLPNNQPEIISSAITSGKVGVTYTYDVNATDPDEDVLIYSLTKKPLGMSIVTNTGVISWIPTDAGLFSVGVKVSDGELSDSQSFSITVAKADDPEPDPKLELIGIVVDPKKMDLIVGGFDNIDSVTACYAFRSYGVILDPKECLFLTSNSKVATVEKVINNTVTVTAVAEGTADILVSYKDKTDTLKVTVSAIPAPKSMEIIVDMPVFTFKESARFTVEIKANSDVGKMVNVYFTLPAMPPYHNVYYWDDVTEDWVWLDAGDHIFGDEDSGYSLCDEKMVFEGNFSTIGTYTTVVEVWTVKPNPLGGAAVKIEPLCYKVISAVVVPPEM